MQSLSDLETNEHKGSRGTFDYIAEWTTRDFFFSKNDLWDRFGMLGVMGDFVLSCTTGDIAEIGVGESSIYLTALSKKYNRKIYHCDISPSKIINPMTIPGYLNEDYTYMEKDEIQDLSKKAVFFANSSDEFFKVVKFTPIALAFIDGDHNYGQVKKDFDNMRKLMVENGYIFLHDTYPPDETWTDENRCGTVYKLRQELEKDDGLDVFTFPKGCAIGVGLTMVRIKPKNRAFYNE